MTRHDRQLANWLLRRTDGLDRTQVVDHLLRQGLLNRRGCERLAIRDEVDRLVREGMGRCEAMEVVAETFCRSYASVRQAVYYKPKGGVL